MIEFKISILEKEAGELPAPPAERQAADSWSRRELLDAAVFIASRLDNDFLLLGRRCKHSQKYPVRKTAAPLLIVAKSQVGCWLLKFSCRCLAFTSEDLGIISLPVSSHVSSSVELFLFPSCLPVSQSVSPHRALVTHCHLDRARPSCVRWIRMVFITRGRTKKKEEIGP